MGATITKRFFANEGSKNMPSKCIADKPLKDAEGNEFVGFQIFNGNHRGQYKQGEIYPQDFLARKWKYDFEHVDAEAPAKKAKKTPRDSGAGKTDNGPAPTDSAPVEGGNA